MNDLDIPMIKGESWIVSLTWKKMQAYGFGVRYAAG